MATAKLLKKKRIVRYQGKEIPLGSFLETFKYKQFAKNFALTNSVTTAYRLTFGDDPDLADIFGKASELISKPEVQLELTSLLPTDEKIFSVLKTALETPTEAIMSWTEKHRYMETALRLKGFLRENSLDQVGNRVNIQVNINPALEKIYGESVVREVS